MTSDLTSDQVRARMLKQNEWTVVFETEDIDRDLFVQILSAGDGRFFGLIKGSIADLEAAALYEQPLHAWNEFYMATEWYPSLIELAADNETDTELEHILIQLYTAHLKQEQINAE